MKKIFLFLLVAILATISKADNPIKGIIVTYPGAEVCYKLDDVPTVTYSKEDGVTFALLSVKGQQDPVCRIGLKEGDQLVVTYGEYVPATGVEPSPEDKVTVFADNGRKVIKGGKLIIIKDGRQYDVNGTIIK